MQNKIQIFEKHPVRAVWDEEGGQWWFSITDIVLVLTDQPTQDGARNYWKVLKNRLKKEGNESVTNCNQLKMKSADGKFYLTDVADTEQILRLIQSIPSKKAEPFKLWLAIVAKTARKEIEQRGGTVISSQNAKQIGNRNSLPKITKNITPKKGIK